jgi:hypothetical protein
VERVDEDARPRILEQVAVARAESLAAKWLAQRRAQRHAGHHRRALPALAPSHAPLRVRCGAAIGIPNSTPSVGLPRLSRPRSTTVATENLPAGGTVVFFRSEGGHGGQTALQICLAHGDALGMAASGMRPVRSPLTPQERELLDLMTPGRPLGRSLTNWCCRSTRWRAPVKHILRKLGVPGGGDCKGPRASLPPPVDGELSSLTRSASRLRDG